MSPNLKDVTTLSQALCQLTLEGLDSYVFLSEHKLPYSAMMHIEDINNLAEAILEVESLGDAISRAHYYKDMTPS